MRRAFPGAILVVVLLGAAPDPPPLEPLPAEQLVAALAEFNAHARFPLPVLQDDQVERLAAREVVRVRVVPEDRDLPQTIAGLIVVDLPRETVWGALRDPHLAKTTEMHEAQLSEHSYAPSRFYAYLELPWPFTPRQWVIDVEDNYALAEATGNRCWEHAWDGNPDQERIGAEVVSSGRYPELDPDVAQGAIWLDYNRGGWIVISLPGGQTLVGYHVTTVLGGNISDKLVADFSMMRMKKLMLEVDDAAWEARLHFVGDHEPVMGADGQWTAPPATAPEGVRTR